MVLSKKIKQQRIKMQLTQGQLARKANLTRQQISAYETGLYLPSSRTLLILSKILKINLDTL